MIQFKSLTTRIVFLHIVAIVLTALLMPLILFWFLSSEIDTLHNRAMTEQAQTLAAQLKIAPGGGLTLDLPESLRDLYSEAYGRYSYDIVDANGHVLFSSHKNFSSIFPENSSNEKLAFYEAVTGDSTISGASLRKTIDGQTVWIRVAENMTHRDVITDDIIANFFRRVGWIVIPILLVLLATDIFIFRRAVRPLLQASKQAENIGPTRTDVRLPVERMPLEILPLVTAINQALDRLEAGFRVQRQFTADAAHELRTPLAILRMRFDTLAKGPAMTDFHRDIDDMGRVVGKLLEIAELDTLRLDPTEATDLCVASVEVIESIAPIALAEKKDIALTAPDHPVMVKGNADMLRRAIRNLVENAIRYSGPDTCVEIEVTGHGSLFVRDEGPGIPPDQRELIFQRFWRADRQRSTGVGLGLAIVRRVISECGGTISVENRKTGGTEFHIRLQRQ